MIDRNRSLRKEWSEDRIKIGAVSYLNSKPLIEGLDELCSRDELILDVPSRLADDLAHGALDVALIPSVEAFVDPEYEIVSDACVATHGPVLSVKLYSRVHPGSIKTLALDAGSRTSAVLTQVILNERYGVTPKLEQLPLGHTSADTTADAILLIGDRAMFAPNETFHTVWDLGEEWVQWTGLPFVFAMWITRKETQLHGVDHKIGIARDRGVANLKQIATIGAKTLGITEEVAYRYLTKNLYFELGEAERMGLQLFHQLAASMGFVPPRELPFRKDRAHAERSFLLETV